MDKNTAQAIAAVLCRVVDYYRVSTQNPSSISMAVAEGRLADAIEAIPSDVEDNAPHQ